jgi:uncharacterized membrane protein
MEIDGVEIVGGTNLGRGRGRQMERGHNGRRESGWTNALLEALLKEKCALKSKNNRDGNRNGYWLYLIFLPIKTL